MAELSPSAMVLNAKCQRDAGRMFTKFTMLCLGFDSPNDNVSRLVYVGQFKKKFHTLTIYCYYILFIVAQRQFGSSPVPPCPQLDKWKRMDGTLHFILCLLARFHLAFSQPSRWGFFAPS